MSMPSSTLLETRAAAKTPPDSGAFRSDSRSGAHPRLFLVTILTAQLMATLDGTIVNVALPHIQRGLGFSSTGLSWVLNAYILAFGGLLLLGARAGDLLGRRRTFLLGIGLFSVASLAGGFATDGTTLLAARALQGAGSALAAPSALALLTQVFSEGRERVRALGLFTTMAAAGGATGLVAGGLLTEWASWRWVMFVNVPIGVAVLLSGRIVLSETPRRTGRFDLGGALSSTLGMTGLVLGLVEAASQGFTSPSSVVPLVAGAMLLQLFVAHERRVEEPILPLRLLAHRARNAANLARGLVFAGMYGMWFFLPQFLQDLQGYSPLRTGVTFLALPASVFVSSQLTSRVLSDRLKARTLMLGGIGLVAASLVAASRLHVGASPLEALASLVVLGLGSGTSLVSLTSASLTDVEPADAGAASGLVNAAQQIGAALGLSGLVTVFGSVTHHAQLSQAAGTVLSAPARATLIHGIDVTFTAGLAFALVALAVVLVALRPARLPRGGRADLGGELLVEG